MITLNENTNKRDIHNQKNIKIKKIHNYQTIVKSQ
jgi:hypothetical protein